MIVTQAYLDSLTFVPTDEEGISHALTKSGLMVVERREMAHGPVYYTTPTGRGLAWIKLEVVDERRS